MSVLFIDFEDSFSFNIIQEIQRLNISLTHAVWNQLPDLKDYKLIILGPGPGHPQEYLEIFPLIKSHLERGGSVFGICLGHQIIASLFGLEIKRCHTPIHGQSVKLNLSQEIAQYLEINPQIEVQRYNSLSVVGNTPQGFLSYSHENEILILISEGIITYQFHPESMGTICRQAYFRPILKYLL